MSAKEQRVWLKLRQHFAKDMEILKSLEWDLSIFGQIIEDIKETIVRYRV